MPSIKVPAYFGFVLVSMFFSPAAASAQVGALHHFHCTVVNAGSKTLYSSPIVATNMAKGAVMQDWHQHMASAYSLTPTPTGTIRYSCQDLGSVRDKQQEALTFDEKTWEASNYKIVHVAYTLGMAPSGEADRTLVDPATLPTVRAFMSCSTAGTGGVNVYYTGVFAANLKTGNAGRGGRTAIVIDRHVVDPNSVQEVLDRFQAYLTERGDKFVPGNVFACDVKPTEAEAKAAQHSRAYEGGGCTSGCSKIVETGWKQE
jgi:hypothetical protein